MTDDKDLETVVIELRYAGDDNYESRHKFLASGLREGTTLPLGNASLYLRLDNHTMTDHKDQPRELDAQGRPLATVAGPDPGNTDPDELTAPLDPDDDVYTAIRQIQQAARPNGADPK